MWALWTFVVVTLIRGLLLAFGGGGRHTKQLAMHGTVLPIENRPVKILFSIPLQLTFKRHWALFKSCLPFFKAHLLCKLAFITPCYTTPFLPPWNWVFIPPV